MGNYSTERDAGGIPGLCVLSPHVYCDNRGYFTETFNERDFLIAGISSDFIQDDEVFSHKNVVRGFHVNRKHPQAKFIRVICGEIFDVVVDLREGSMIYKQSFSIQLSDKNKKGLYIPEGFGHAYLAMADSIIQLKVTTHYIPGDEIGFSWKSRELKIDWPVEEANVILNEADCNCPDLTSIEML